MKQLIFLSAILFVLFSCKEPTADTPEPEQEINIGLKTVISQTQNGVTAIGSDGRELWSFMPFANAVPTSQAKVIDNKLYISFRKEDEVSGSIYVLNTETGALIETIEAKVFNDFAIKDNILLVGELEKIVALNFSTKDTIWSIPKSNTEFLLNDQIFYSNLDEQFISAVNLKTGEILWEQKIAEKQECPMDEITRKRFLSYKPILENNKLIVPIYNSILTLNAENGQLISEFKTGDEHDYYNLTASNDSIFVGLSSGIYCFDANTTNVFWKATSTSIVDRTVNNNYKNYTSRPKLVGENLYINGNQLSAKINAKNGAIIWKKDIYDLSLDPSSQIINDNLIICAWGNTIFELETERGDANWVKNVSTSFSNARSKFNSFSPIGITQENKVLYSY